MLIKCGGQAAVDIMATYNAGHGTSLFKVTQENFLLVEHFSGLVLRFLGMDEDWTEKVAGSIAHPHLFNPVQQILSFLLERKVFFLSVLASRVHDLHGFRFRGGELKSHDLIWLWLKSAILGFGNGLDKTWKTLAWYFKTWLILEPHDSLVYIGSIWWFAHMCYPPPPVKCVQLLPRLIAFKRAPTHLLHLPTRWRPSPWEPM